MKILSDEEKVAHSKTLLVEGAKGTAVGLGVAWGLVTFMKKKYPARWASYNMSIRACMWALPLVALGAYWADEGSLKFDEQRYRSDYFLKMEKDELERWNKLSTGDKAFTVVNDNKYKIIVGAWAASLYGSWVVVNKDQYMSRAQKIVQARVYAQGITVLLLLCTILLSVHEAELKKKEPPPVPEWKKYLEEQKAANEQNISTQTK